jgi:hypothetical protein
MVNYDEEILKRVDEINHLFGKRLLNNVSFEDFRVYTKDSIKKVNGKVKNFQYPYVVIHIPRYNGGGLRKGGDYYKLGHRIVVPFTDKNPKTFNVRDKDVVEKIMLKVKEHGQKFFGLTEDEIKFPK